VEVYPLNKGFRYDGEVLDREAFKKRLYKRTCKDRNCVMFIMMKRKVKYARLVDTLSVAREIGFKRISLKNAEGPG